MKCKISLGPLDPTFPKKALGGSGIGLRHLLGELDVVKDDQRTFDIEHSSVVDARSDVVVGSYCLNVYL